MRSSGTRSITPVRTPSTVRPPVVDITVIIPTRHERETVDVLVERVRRALGPTGYHYEVLFVDDSDDETPEAIAAHEGVGSPVRLLHRRPGTRAGGLAGALCAGFADARGSHALCISGDLQHPPELLAPMARVLIDGIADVVVGTRYVAGGESAGLGSAWRRMASAASRDVTRLALPRLRATTDPGSGLFGIHLDILRGVELDPRGNKPLVEVLARGNWTSIAEVPYRFGARPTGRSSASVAEGLQFARHLTGLASNRAIRRRRRPVGTCVAFGMPSGDPDGPESSTLVLSYGN